jgi:hypothetical protein
MACAAGKELGSQGRRAPRVTARGRGAATPGGPAAGRLGGPSAAGWAGAAAAAPGPAQVVGAAGHAAALASRPGLAPLDLPPTGVAGRVWRRSSARWCCGWPGRTRLGATGGSTASCAGSATASGPAPCGRSCRAPALTRHPSVGPDLVAVPPGAGQGCAGGGLLHCGHGVPKRLHVLFVIEWRPAGPMCLVSRRIRWKSGWPSRPGISSKSGTASAGSGF